MPKKILSEKLKKEVLTISIPKYIKDELETMPNRNDLIVQIFEENRDRIMSGDIDKAIQYKNAKIKQEVMDLISKERDKLIVPPLSKIDSILEQLKKLQSELKALSLSLLKSKKLIKLELDKEIDRTSSRLQEEFGEL